MQIKKALITAAGPDQRNLPLQTLIDSDGNRKTVLEILIRECNRAGIDEIGVVIHQGDSAIYAGLAYNNKQVKFIEQDKPLGYGYALLCGASFTGNDPFLHLIGDHSYVPRSEMSCAVQVTKIASEHNCTVSAVTPTRESLIPSYGTVGGKRVPNTKGLYTVDTVIEKPTPTLAEQKLIIPGFRAGHYLCFSGMHVLTPKVIEILKKNLQHAGGKPIGLSEALNELAGKEQYLALENHDWRFDMGSRYGLLKAQLALALNGKDRDLLMTELLEFFTARQQSAE